MRLGPKYQQVLFLEISLLTPRAHTGRSEHGPSLRCEMSSTPLGFCHVIMPPSKSGFYDFGWVTPIKIDNSKLAPEHLVH